MENRAGVFMNQPSGYKSFVPKKLPPDPMVNMDLEMLKLLSDADRKLGRLDGITQFVRQNILTDITPHQQRNKRYCFVEYVNILNRGTEL